MFLFLRFWKFLTQHHGIYRIEYTWRKYSINSLIHFPFERQGTFFNQAKKWFSILIQFKRSTNTLECRLLICICRSTGHWKVFFGIMRPNKAKLQSLCLNQIFAQKKTKDNLEKNHQKTASSADYIVQIRTPLLPWLSLFCQMSMEATVSNAPYTT